MDIQRRQFKRLGVWGDWDNPYITMHPEYEAVQIRLFGDMVEKGYVYKAKSPFIGAPTARRHWQRPKLSITIIVHPASMCVSL